MTTLGDIVRDVVFELGFRENTATGGTTATLIDSDLGGNDDDYNGGLVIVTQDSALGGAAPEDEFAEVTDYTSSTGTITCAASSFTVAPASGDSYIVTMPDYPYRQILRAINRGLQELGDIPKVDTTTLDTASAQTEYDYAITWKRKPPYRIDLQEYTNDANDNRWSEISRGFWYHVPAAAGSAGKIIFKGQLPTGRDLRVWYQGPHDAVDTYSDTIYEGFHPDLVVAEATYRLLRWRFAEQRGADDHLAQLLNEAQEWRERKRQQHLIWKPQRRSKIFTFGSYVDDDEFTVPGPP